MPIPKPNNKESKKDFMKRCMADSTMKSEYDDKQRYAICEAQLKEKKSNNNIWNNMENTTEKR